jgi:hypothetical protein
VRSAKGLVRVELASVLRRLIDSRLAPFLQANRRRI